VGQVQARRDEPFVQCVGFDGPAPVDAFGLVQFGVGTQGIELMPSELMARGETQRGVCVVPALGQVVRAQHLPEPPWAEVTADDLDDGLGAVVRQRPAGGRFLVGQPVGRRVDQFPDQAVPEWVERPGRPRP
jgi:hypothetical protein